LQRRLGQLAVALDLLVDGARGHCEARAAVGGKTAEDSA